MQIVHVVNYWSFSRYDEVFADIYITTSCRMIENEKSHISTIV